MSSFDHTLFTKCVHNLFKSTFDILNVGKLDPVGSEV